MTGHPEPLASIVICSYNYGRFVAEAIDSALDQTYPHVEVVVVDDGSTDDSRDVIGRYGERVEVILQDNHGHDAAIYRGFLATHGETVCFLDSDDRLLPTAMEKAANALRGGDVAKAHWPLRIIDEDGSPTGRLLPGGRLPSGDLAEIVLRHGPQSYPSPPTSGNAWARWFLERVFPLAAMENRAGTADDQLSMLAPLFGRIAVLDPQGCFRAHGGNNYWGKTLEHLGVTVRDYERSCAVLASTCRRLGLTAEPEDWKRESWFLRLNRAVQDIASVTAPDDRLLLIDDDKWGADEWIGGRRRVGFPGRSSEHPGRPADDAAAIRHLSRARASGASHLVIGWPAYWWMDQYPVWYRHVQSLGHCLVSNDRVTVFSIA